MAMGWACKSGHAEIVADQSVGPAMCHYIRHKARDAACVLPGKLTAICRYLKLTK